MGFLARIGLGFLGGAAVKWLAAAGIAAAVSALAYGLIEYGISLRASKVAEQIMNEQKINRERNYQVDKKTINKDAELILKLQEIDQTWAPKTTVTP